jgi:hypothetical protein
MTYTSKKINTGIYIVTFANGARIRIERYPDGLWNTFDENAADRLCFDTYMQTYCTKTDAFADLIAHADQLI